MLRFFWTLLILKLPEMRALAVGAIEQTIPLLLVSMLRSVHETFLHFKQTEETHEVRLMARSSTKEVALGSLTEASSVFRLD